MHINVNYMILILLYFEKIEISPNSILISRYNLVSLLFVIMNIISKLYDDLGVSLG